MAAVAVSFLCGLLFALGLVIGGMTQPAKVFGFLDASGAFDPSLAFVMAGALATHALLRRFVVARARPWMAESFSLPTRTEIDRRLIAGAALFGVGWAIAGFCPGPALVAFGGGVRAAVIFVPAMLAGMLLYDRWYAHRELRRESVERASLAIEDAVQDG